MGERSKRRGVGTIRERRPGVFELRVFAGRDPVTGRPRQSSTTFHGSWKQAEVRLAALVTEQATNRPAPVTSESLAALVERWIEVCRSGWASRTSREYERLCRTRVVPSLGGIAVRDLTTRTINDFYLELQRDGLGARSVRQIHAVLSGALRFGIADGWLTTNPALGAKLPPAPKPKPRPPTPTEVVKLLRCAETENPTLYRMLRLAADLGCRRGELVALRGTDFDSGRVWVRRSVVALAGGGWEEKPTKTESEASVAISPDVYALFADMERFSGFVFSPDGGVSPWMPDTVTHWFGQVRSAAGLPHVKLRSLRHFHVTQLLSAGVDVRQVAGRVRHANPSMTLSVYGAWLPDRDATAATVVSDLLASEGAP